MAAGAGCAWLAAGGQPLQYYAVAPVFDAVTGLVHEIKLSDAFQC
jgi:hypothetical protein